MFIGLRKVLHFRIEQTMAHDHLSVTSLYRTQPLLLLLALLIVFKLGTKH